MAAQELLEGAGQLARRARISGLVALCAVELCFLWVSIKSDVKVQRCYFYYNYSGVMENAMDLRLIQEFSGDGSVNVIEWLEKAELVCALRGITRLEAVLPLRLTGGAFAVYQQLTAEDKADSGKIKFALKTAFAVDAFTAYELFVARRLQPGETVDVYLAELRRLAVPFGGLPEKALVSAFVAGLPDGAKQLPRAGSRMDDLPLTHILARARACQVCQSIDPAPVKWAKGELNVEVWSRVGMDVTHVNGRHYLTLIDCGPARFAVWRQLRRQDTASIIEQLEMVFLERGAPPEILTDNDTAFRSEAFVRFAEKWAMRVRFRSAYVTSGNGIAERCHRSVKRIAARMGCPIAEAVYWYNVTPKDDVDPASAPANKLYSYEIRVRGVDRVLTDELGDVNSPYDVGDDVWVKPPGSRFNTKYQLGTVTKLISPHTVEVGGMPRHVRDLRSAVLLEANPERAPRHELLGDDDEAPGVAPVRVRPGSVVGNDDGVDIGRGEDAAVDANDDAAVDADDDAAVDADDDAAVDADDDAASLPAARHAAESSNSEDEAPPERPGLRRSTRERRAPNWFMAGQ